MAQAVAAELGPDVLHAVENPATTRAFGVSEATFIIACAQLAVELWSARRDRALLVLALAEGLEGRSELANQLDPERRLGIVARIVNKLIPESGTSSPSIEADKRPDKAEPRNKQEWLTDWTGLGDTSRAMTQPILLPFADMDNWIVFKPIHWTPPANAPTNLPRAVSVPAGFVSDLATIPNYFWWALPPQGRYGHAALLHDWLYWQQGVSRATADKVFEVAMGELNVDLPLRKAMWAAVRVGGGEYWSAATAEKRRGGSRILKRFPETPVTYAEWKKNPGVFTGNEENKG